ncbi:ubiquitin carboxyl-terminal hydrolase 2, putative [Plasmodium ovale]|uniref:Ubiquitin carboxyl-terminal hydrolase 2, putative n=1 Tax=Plasmodium ovale TaxID=36330 RepID=A0A1D3U8N1_PLAOA|nr:ubiquitin carboxyl-terminal hydrolase 2, putative [Plasmodium ovale]
MNASSSGSSTNKCLLLDKIQILNLFKIFDNLPFEPKSENEIWYIVNKEFIDNLRNYEAGKITQYNSMIKNKIFLEEYDSVTTRTRLVKEYENSNGSGFVLYPEKAMEIMEKHFHFDVKIPRAVYKHKILKRDKIIFKVDIQPLKLIVYSKNPNEHSNPSQMKIVILRSDTIEDVLKEIINNFDRVNFKRNLFYADELSEKREKNWKCIYAYDSEDYPLNKRVCDYNIDETCCLLISSERVDIKCLMYEGDHSNYGKKGGGSSRSYETKEEFIGVPKSISYIFEKGGDRGLINLGNTCFLNSSLQCLAKVLKFSNYFLSGTFWKHINYSNPVGQHGRLAKAYYETLIELWKINKRNEPYAPKVLKQAISEKRDEFYGYQQHDSQELLAFLLDGLHEDLNLIRKKPYYEEKLQGGIDKPDIEVAEASWKRHKEINNSVIVDLFQGQYRSRLQCPKCKKVSITFDPFMYLSIPLPPKKNHRIWFHVMLNRDNPIALRFSCSFNGSQEILKLKIFFLNIIKHLKKKKKNILLHSKNIIKNNKYPHEGNNAFNFHSKFMEDMNDFYDEGLETDIVEEGVVEEGVVEEGVVEEGVVEKGVVEKGVVEKGVVEKGVVEKGVVEKGVVEKGMVEKGMVEKGMVEKGMVEKGMMDGEKAEEERGEGVEAEEGSEDGVEGEEGSEEGTKFCNATDSANRTDISNYVGAMKSKLRIENCLREHEIKSIHENICDMCNVSTIEEIEINNLCFLYTKFKNLACNHFFQLLNNNDFVTEPHTRNGKGISHIFVFFLPKNFTHLIDKNIELKGDESLEVLTNSTVTTNNTSLKDEDINVKKETSNEKKTLKNKQFTSKIIKKRKGIIPSSNNLRKAGEKNHQEDEMEGYDEMEDSNDINLQDVTAPNAFSDSNDVHKAGAGGAADVVHVSYNELLKDRIFCNPEGGIINGSNLHDKYFSLLIVPLCKDEQLLFKMKNNDLPLLMNVPFNFTTTELYAKVGNAYRKGGGISNSTKRRSDNISEKTLQKSVHGGNLELTHVEESSGYSGYEEKFILYIPCYNLKEEWVPKDNLGLGLKQDKTYLSDYIKNSEEKRLIIIHLNSNEIDEELSLDIKTLTFIDLEEKYGIDTCLKLFSEEEHLDENNTWYCGNCKLHVQAYKKLDLFRMPIILILHLKRFNNTNRWLRTKIDSYVYYPYKEKEYLNMTPYILEDGLKHMRKLNSNYSPMYELIGVNCHTGGLCGGHYFAYVKLHGQWYNFNDTYVTTIDESQVNTKNAYLLFYQLFTHRDEKFTGMAAQGGMPEEEAIRMANASYYN